MKEFEPSPGPHTDGGMRDMLMFGRCMEQMNADGTWRHIPYEEWNPGYVPLDESGEHKHNP